MEVVLILVVVFAALALYEYRLRRPDQIVVAETRRGVRIRSGRLYPRHFSTPIAKTTHSFAQTVDASAKGNLDIRVKLAVTPDSQGQAVANFLADEAAGWNSATDHYLRGGDLNGDNIVNVSDYNLMAAYWFDLVSVVPAAALADITGDGVINLFEYAIMGDNWLQAGDPQ